ncbi:oligosaccharide flippase family protein [Desulfosporosinus sp. Sb-LF]|uniref:oligosaccharide flippase family protein n=1 Tax=Desulfosporosinus sp. Sb-LF TaxID=2560027 RepID=UPI001A7EC985|nr:oligosaccharide flippase family protein [Desulfosporosinus sp. Sb-LF]
MKENSFIKHFMVIGAGTLITMFMGLLTTPIITRIITPEDYGQLSIFNMYTSIAIMVLCLGLDQSLVRYYYSEKDLKYRSGLLFKCVVVPVLSTVAISVIVIILSVFHIIEFEFAPKVIVLLCIHILFQLIYRFSVLVVRLEYKSKLFSLLNILSKSVYVGLALPLMFFIKIDYFLSLILATVTAGLLCLLFSIFWQKDVWNFRNCTTQISVSFKSLVQYGWPFIISMGMTQLFQAVDKISLNYFCTYKEVGIYSSALSLVNIFAIIQSTFNSLWAPMAVEHYENDKEDCKFYQQVNQYITIVMFGIGFSLILVKDLLVLLLGSEFREAAYILPFLIFNPIMYTISETTVSGIVFMKKSKMQIVIGAISCLVNFVGNSFLVPVYGYKGAAISTGISYIVFFTLRTLISNRYFYIDFALTRFYIMTVIAVLYAWYNTFYQFGVISVVLYVICVSILLLLYRRCASSGATYLYKMIIETLKIKKLKGEDNEK